MRLRRLVPPLLVAIALAACRGGSLWAVETPLAVTFDGSMGCATFPYGCIARLSVLAPGTAVDEAWRPPTTDVTWSGQASGGFGEPKPAPGSPSGRHLLVFSVLETSDVPTFGPDGSVQMRLLGRCSVEADIPAQGDPVEVTVRFPADFSSFCEIAVGGPLATALSDTTGP